MSKRMVHLGLAALLLATVSRADDVDRARVLPAMPRVGESVLLIVEGVWPLACAPVFTRNVSIEGREVQVLLSASAEDPPPGGCATVLTPYRTTVELGVLQQEGPFDIEVLLVDTPFLPTVLTQLSFEVVPRERLELDLPTDLTASERGQVLLYGEWLEGCVPDRVSVERRGYAVELISHLRSDLCGTEARRFAQAFLLPPLPEGAAEIRWLVEEQYEDGGPIDRLLREVTELSVGDAVTRPSLAGDRFEVEVVFAGDRLAKVAPGSTGDTALFTFFDPANLEMQVKVLDGCGLNGHFWVFGAASTDLDFTIEVTDTATSTVRRYSNPAGVAASAINDTAAFPCDSG